jgi:hypothetical protein
MQEGVPIAVSVVQGEALNNTNFRERGVGAFINASF